MPRRKRVSKESRTPNALGGMTSTPPPVHQDKPKSRRFFRLPDILLKRNILTEEQMKECLCLQKQQRMDGQDLCEIIVRYGYCSYDRLAEIISEECEIPLVELESYKIAAEVLDEVPESLVRQYEMLPISITDDVLTLVMTNPFNTMALDDLRMLTSYEIETAVSSRPEILKKIDELYSKTAEPPRKIPLGRNLFYSLLEDFSKVKKQIENLYIIYEKTIHSYKDVEMLSSTKAGLTILLRELKEKENDIINSIFDCAEDIYHGDG